MATPPDREDLLELFRSTTPDSFHEPIESDPRGSFRLIEGFAQLFAILAARGSRSAQATFYLPHATQSDVPASSRGFATAMVQIDRTQDLDAVRCLEVGRVRFRGLGGRTYVNAATVEWIPQDPSPTKTITVVCEFAGFAGNLDHVADDSGNLTTQDGEPDTAAFDFDDQSQDRTGIEGGIVVGASSTQIVDSGIGDRFVAGDVGLYVRIDSHPDAANVGRVLRIVGFAEQPFDPLTGLVRNAIEVDDGPQRRPLRSAQADDGGVFTDETTAANETTADDMTLLPATPAPNDAYVMGSETTFGRLVMIITTAGAGTYTIAGEYWNGASWAALPDFADGSSHYMVDGTVEFTWTIPGDWAQNTINSVTAFHMRLRLDTLTSVTQQPLAGQAYTFNGDRLVNTGGTDGDTTWSVLDWSDLGFRLLSIQAPTGGRDDDLFLLGEERGVYQQTDETDDDFRARAARLRDVVTPNAIQRAVNRALEPFGFRGEAIDVQNGLTGFFFDVDAFDYYEPGDTFPEDPWKLFSSYQEAFGWFLVVLPWLGFGDYGMFYDEGPTLFLPESGEYTGPAFGAGFYDGEALSANASYRSIWDQVNAIRAGFVGFTMIRDDRLNEPICP